MEEVAKEGARACRCAAEVENAGRTHECADGGAARTPGGPPRGPPLLGLGRIQLGEGEVR